MSGALTSGKNDANPAGSRRRWPGSALLVSFALSLAALITPRGALAEPAAQVKVGSKKFTESVILSEVVVQLIRSAGGRAEHRAELGGTTILWNALLAGEIDIYPEYTGTIGEEILSAGKDGAKARPFKGAGGEEAMRAALAERGVVMSRPLGFNNTYAVGMKRAAAEKLGVRTISDLGRHPELALGFSNEFMSRGDGWPSLRDRYGLPQRDVRGLDHDLAYRGLSSGAIAATDLYSTDAEIAYYDILVLKDDLGHFPAYDAVLLHRADLASRAPEAAAAALRLEGKINEATMIGLNARAKLDKIPEPRVAADFLATSLGVRSAIKEEGGRAQRILARTVEHLSLVSVSLFAAILAAIPLGVLAARRPRAGQVILAVVGLVQTIPSLALLVFMIPILGIGGAPAVAALFLYSLLPIVRNTYTGIHDISAPIRESAEALGLPPGARLRLVELPIASRAILGGIKTSAVINVGTATLGALIGAGGYGQPILTGIRLDDVGLILEGAAPAAALALLVQGLFELAERALVPKGLRLRPATSGSE
ncbi:MAG TPA: glycine betaine ABC transporter substrate-binding protein [Polyangiaceae bacterium]|nr:glycine betaine ABC transporter substrate-binding protein [Polyangiaceae bacterium]